MTTIAFAPDELSASLGITYNTFDLVFTNTQIYSWSPFTYQDLQ